jgi:Mrp family chromosome partitioning ATPase
LKRPQPHSPGDTPSWVRNRARNTFRHPFLIAAIGGVAFVATLVMLVVVPREARREAQSVAPRAGERPDTMPLVARLARANGDFERANAAYIAARDRALQPPPPVPVVMAQPPEIVARRDSLARRAAVLDSLVARIEKAPLLGSYRALGDVAELRGQPRIQAMLDTLANIESEREAFSAVGGVDPMFVTLTTQATQIGRTMQYIGESVRDDMRRRIVALTPPPPPRPLSFVVDTVTPRVRAENARLAQRSADSTLADARRVNIALDERERRARELANVAAPPLAMLAASLVFGLFVGFGIALIAEARTPRIADEGEAERIAGARVLGVVSPTVVLPERQRRQADREVPPLVDLNAPSYRYAYLHLASSASRLIMVTIAGDHPIVVATVAANIAAVSAQEARSTLVIDADPATSTIADVLHTRREPGLTEIVRGSAGWPEAITHAMIGRDRMLDVVPAGTVTPLPAPEQLSDLLARDLARLSRRYETLVVIVPLEQLHSGLATRLPVPDVIYCARLGQTTLVQLAKATQGLRLGGAEVRGVVLWDMEEPRLVARADDGGQRAEETEAKVAAE